MFLQGLTFCEKHDHNSIVKRKQLLLPFFVCVLFLSVTSSVVFANHGVVLGVSDSQVKVEMPPTHGGPGFILPDSPLYVLDNVKQTLRVAFAFGAEARAKAYTAVANERLAELRIMLAKNDEKGIRVALEGVYDNFENAANEINNARLRGKNVSKTAKEIVNLAREHQEILDVVESQAEGVLQKQVAVAQESILASKVKISDSLSQKDLAEEIRYDLNRQDTVVLGETIVATPSPTIVQVQKVATTPAVVK